MQRTAQTPAATPSTRSYQQMLTKLLRHGAYPQLRKIVDRTLPADLSPVLPLLLEEDRMRVLSLLIEAGKAARALLELDEADLREILDPLDDSTVAAICSSSAPDDAADHLDQLDDERRQRVLDLLGSTHGAKLESLLEGEEETAGSLMNTDFLALDEELTVAQAIEAIRQYPRKEAFFYVYCVDSDGHLVGVLSLRSLILAEPHTELRNIMVQSVVRTQIDSTPARDSFLMRFPWLAINLATAFLASWVVSRFEGTIAKWAALAVFMPIVAGMGGNAGTQTLTVFVRGLAL